MSDYATCPHCGATFYRDEPWKRLCLNCWKREKGQQRGSGSSMDGYLQGYRDGLAAGRAEAPAQDPLGDRLPRLIQLCHPDKHANSPAATEITQWLLSLRRARR